MKNPFYSYRGLDQVTIGIKIKNFVFTISIATDGKLWSITSEEFTHYMPLGIEFGPHNKLNSKFCSIFILWIRLTFLGVIR